MTDVAFADRSHEPTPAEVEAVLGEAAPLWRALRNGLAAAHAPATEQWRFFSPKSGWSLQVLRGKRTVFWLNPRAGHFLASTAFGDRAVEAAREAGLPDEVMRAIESAPKYTEGRPVRVEVRSGGDVELALRLAAIKMGT